VPVDTDLQEIIKEISIMQQCDSPYVVKYYGSYFKNTDLWIVMEYCGAGSVLDIMKLRGMAMSQRGTAERGEVKTLNEDEIATILCDTLKGLEYLHVRKKIHRDIKAGNILLNSEGHAKLADFGVAGQLTDTMAKRNTVIGTPFWMAPEVIQEIGYDCVADIWSLGITALEMAEGKAPYGDIHPMRAIFMIPSKPPPSFNQPDKWSSEFIEFVSRCLVKNPEERATASELLQHDFIKNAKSPDILAEMIAEAQQIREHLQETTETSMVDDSSQTMVPGDEGTLVRYPTLSKGDTEESDGGGTMIIMSTLEGDNKKTTSNVKSDYEATSEISSNLGTMVINDNEDGDDDTMVTRKGESSNYRPPFLDHFDKTDSSKSKDLPNESSNTLLAQGQTNAETSTLTNSNTNNLPNSDVQEKAQEILNKRLLEQISGGQIQDGPSLAGQGYSSTSPGNNNTSPSMGGGGDNNQTKFQRCIAEGDLDFLKFLSFDELKGKMSNLDQDMEREIDDLRRRYHAKRQPILDAMDQKRKRQQNF
jgi:serine/threonine kinase 3